MNTAESACVGKAPFKSYALATEVTKRPGNRDKQRSAYHCQFCHQWHVGTHSKSVKPRKVVRK